MQANQKTTASYVPQQEVEKLQFELNVDETRFIDNQVLPEEDVKFIGTLGWLSAAAVLIASLSVLP
ncbi:MAG: hypothetical protein ABI144_06045 [Gallionella sp.]